MNMISEVKKQKFWYKIFLLALDKMNIGGGSGVEDSGEKYVLKYLHGQIIKSEKPVLFDVGANIGGYTLELKNFFENAEIHCFEPAKETYKNLCKNINNKNVILNNFGMSDECSECTLFYDIENSGMASLYNRQLDYFGLEFSKSEKVVLETIDYYCSRKDIKYIDFLKIDVEGNELKTLLGAKEMLAGKNIGAIQVEFGGTNIDARTYFRDFWNLLHENFIIYRILKNGLFEIEKYDEHLEIFTCTNYLFLSR